MEVFLFHFIIYLFLAVLWCGWLQGKHMIFSSSSVLVVLFWTSVYWVICKEKENLGAT